MPYKLVPRTIVQDTSQGSGLDQDTNQCQGYKSGFRTRSGYKSVSRIQVRVQD